MKNTCLLIILIPIYNIKKRKQKNKKGLLIIIEYLFILIINIWTLFY